MDNKKEHTHTVQGGETPVPVRGLSGRAGSPGPSSNDRPALPAGDQAGSGSDTTGSEEGRRKAREKELGFQRRPRVGRSPARARISSLPNAALMSVATQHVDGSETSGNESTGNESAGAELKGERKRELVIYVEDSVVFDSTDEAKDLRSSPVLAPAKKVKVMRPREAPKGPGPKDGLSELLEKLCWGVKSLYLITEGSRNTKKDIKDLAYTLNELGEKVLEEKGFLEEEKRGKRPHAVRRGNGEPECAAPAKKITTRTCTVGTQTEKNSWQKRNDSSAEKIRKQIESARNFNELEEIMKENWPEQTYRAVREIEGNPLKQDVELNLSFWKGRRAEMDSGIYRQMATRFPDLLDITEEEKTADEVLSWVYESRKATKDGPQNYKRRTITSINIGETDEDIYKHLSAWKDRLEALDVRRIAFPVPKTGWQRIKKIMEYTLHGSEIIAKAYKPQTGEEHKTPAPKGKQTTQLKTRTMKKLKSEDEVLIVSTGKPYVEALRQIKQNINVENIGAKIKHTRCTRNGEVLITLDKGGCRSSDLRKEIQDKLGSQGVTSRTGRRDDMILHIRGMEATTSKEEVQKALVDAVGAKEGDIKMGTMRPAYGGTQNVSVVTNRLLGQAIIEKSPLQIGWAVCRVIERVEVKRCLKCWRAGHLARACQSDEDRTQCCLRCGSAEHLVKDCRNKPFCPLCQKEGHRSDSFACPEFRRTVEAKKGSGIGQDDDKESGRPSEEEVKAREERTLRVRGEEAGATMDTGGDLPGMEAVQGGQIPPPI